MPTFQQLIDDFNKRFQDTATKVGTAGRVATGPQVLIADQAQANYGIELPDDTYTLKLLPTETGFNVSYLTDSGWEITDKDLIISPDGTQYTRAELDRIIAKQQTSPAYSPEDYIAFQRDLQESNPDLWKVFANAGGGEAGFKALQAAGESINQTNAKNFIDWQADLQTNHPELWDVYVNAGGGEAGIAAVQAAQQADAINLRDVFGNVFTQEDIDTAIQLATTDPTAFITQIKSMGMNDQTVKLLKLAFDATDEEIEALFAEDTIAGLSVSEIETMSQDSPEELLRFIIATGKNDETIALLQELVPQLDEAGRNWLFEHPTDAAIANAAKKMVDYSTRKTEYENNPPETGFQGEITSIKSLDQWRQERSDWFEGLNAGEQAKFLAKSGGKWVWETFFTEGKDWDKGGGENAVMAFVSFAIPTNWIRYPLTLVSKKLPQVVVKSFVGKSFGKILDMILGKVDEFNTPIARLGKEVVNVIEPDLKELHSLVNEIGLNEVTPEQATRLNEIVTRLKAKGIGKMDDLSKMLADETGSIKLPKRTFANDQFAENYRKMQVPGEPEAGIQSDIFGGGKEVHPAGKSKVVQESMDDFLKLRQTLEGKTNPTSKEQGILNAIKQTEAKINDYVSKAKTDKELSSWIKGDIEELQNELMARSTPFHGGAKGLFPGESTEALNAQLNTLRQFEDTLPATVKLPDKITLKMEDDLLKNGFTPDEIAKMTPEEALAKLASDNTPVPEVKATPKTEVPPVEPPEPPKTTVNPEPPEKPVLLKAKTVDDVAKQVTEAIKDAAPAREITEELKHKELSKRAAIAASYLQSGEGAKAFEQSKAALKGALPQASDYTLDLDKFGITNADIDLMFNKIRTSDLQYFQKLNTSEALSNLLCGVIPTEGELVLLERMFGKDLVNAVISKMSFMKKAGMLLQTILNIPRTLQTIGDLSATLRQGAVLAFGQPVEFSKAFIAQMKAVFSEKYYKLIDATLHNMKYADKAELHKLYLAPIEEVAAVTAREEAFMGRILEKIPVLGSIVRASERAYNTFLNTLRMETWARYCRAWEGTGKSWKDYDKLASFINHATGRGDLGKLENAGAWLNAAFFSPRYIASRIQVPLDLITSTPAVRKVVARNLLAFFGAGAGALGLAYLAGAEVELDPRSTDFGKIKIGNTRIDFWAGFQPYARLIAQLISGERKITSTGAITEVNRQDIIATFLRSKLAPIPGLTWDLGQGKTFIGEELTAENAGTIIYEKLTPMFIQDMIDAIKDSGIGGTGYGLLSGIGVGVQTYANNWNTEEDKLGLPVSSEDLPYTIEKDTYTMQDYYSIVGGMIGTATADMLDDKKNIPEKVRLVAQVRDLKRFLADYPNDKLYNINFDTTKGDTFENFYAQWQARQKITDPAELKEFDKQYPDAYKGNISKAQLVALTHYNALDEAGKKQFRVSNPDEWALINTNPREQWLKEHPLDNAQLALCGQAKILTPEAYAELQKLITKYDIPLNAVPDLNLPAKEDIDDYFKYKDIQDKYGSASAEAKLLLLDNDSLRDFLGLSPVTTPRPVLDIQVKNRAVQDQFDALETEQEQISFKESHPGWVDDELRIDAYNSTFKYDGTVADKKIVDKWVEYSHLETAAEKELFRADNPDFDKWGQTSNPGENWKALDIKSVDALRLNVKNQDLKAERDALLSKGDRNEWDLVHPEYVRDQKLIEAYNSGATKEVAELYADWKLLPTKDEQDLFLYENKSLYEFAQKELLAETFTESEVKVLEIKVKNKDLTAEYNNLTTPKEKNDWLKAHPEYVDDQNRITAYKNGVSDTYIEAYVEYQNTIKNQPYSYADERWLQSNQDYYNDVWLGILDKDEINFTKVPSERWEITYNTMYLKLKEGEERTNFRRSHGWFNEEGIRIGKWSPLPIKKTTAKSSSIKGKWSH